MPHLASPPGICLLPALNQPYPPSFTDTIWWQIMPFLTRVRQVGQGDGLAVGEPYHLLTTAAIPHTLYNSLELSSLTSLKAWGEKQKICHDIAFLLILAEEEATGDRRYCLSTIWVNSCQARVCSMEEVVRELTTWVSSGPNWPYALVQLNKDTHHALLPKEGHLGICLKEGLIWLLVEESASWEFASSSFQACSCLPGGVEWMWGIHFNLPAQVPGQQHKPNWRQIHLLGNWHPATHSRGAGSEGIAHWQTLHYHYNQPPEDHSP